MENASQSGTCVPTTRSARYATWWFPHEVRRTGEASLSRGGSTSPRSRAAARGRAPDPACPGPLDDGGSPRSQRPETPFGAGRRGLVCARTASRGSSRGQTGLARLAGGRQMSPRRRGRPTGHDRVGAIRAAPSRGRRRQSLARVGRARAAGNHAGRLPTAMR